MKLLLLASLFILPLLGATGNLGYEQIKVLFFIVSITLIGFLWMGKGIKWTLISKAAGLFISILLITSLVGSDPKSSLLGKEPYFQGWVVYAYLFLLSLIVSSLINLKDIATSLTASGLVVSALAIEDWILKTFFGFYVPDYAGRVVSTFGQPNFYAGFLLLNLPFSYLLLQDEDKKLRIFGLVCGLLSFIAIFVSYSRSTILMALLLLILGLIGELKIKIRLGLAVSGVIVISILTALIFSSGIIGNEVSGPAATKNPDLTKESVEKRAYIWPQALKIALQKPVTGYGLENIGLSFANYFAVNKHLLFEENLQIYPVLISLKELNIDRSHNYILDLLLFSGILGLLSWLILVILLIKKITKHQYKNLLLISLGTYLIWIQFQNQSVVHLVYFWLLVGLIDSEDQFGRMKFSLERVKDQTKSLKRQHS